VVGVGGQIGQGLQIGNGAVHASLLEVSLLGVDGQLAAGLLFQPAQQIARAQVLDGLGAAQVKADMIGADVFRAGQRAQIAHDAGVKQRCGCLQLAAGRQGNALLHRDMARTGAVAAAAMAAVTFREGLLQLGRACQPSRKSCGR
jgi:hypothetical protein